MKEHSRPTLAIIGGGQLGMLLCKAARDLDVKTIIVVPTVPAPAEPFADVTLVSPLDSKALAEQIASQADYVTFEFENVPPALLDGLAEQEKQQRVIVRPGVDTLKLLQNKATQKAWLTNHDYPTLGFMDCQQPQAEKQKILDAIGLPFVQKAARGGYDGYGVQIIRSAQELPNLWDVPSIIEPYIDDPVELGVVVARTATGEMSAFHPVRMTFDRKKNVLDAVHSPTGLGQEIDDAATQLAKDVVNGLNDAGVFAVEMFLLPDSRLVINEISPRVHNSGHHTVEACQVSQFDQHVRAVCGLPLGDPGVSPPAAIMRNLLYTKELDFMMHNPPDSVVSDSEGVYLHWYGKREAHEGRKLGHVTCLCSDADEAQQRMDNFINSLRIPAEEKAT